MDLIYICEKEIVLEQFLNREESFISIDQASHILNRGVRKLTQVCLDYGIPIFEVYCSLTKAESMKRQKFIPLNSFYAVLSSEITVLKEKKVHKTTKLLGRSVQSSFSHRSMTQRFLSAADKDKFVAINIENCPKFACYYGILFNL